MLVFCLCSCAETTELKPTENFYVNDFADVLTEADEQEILTKAVALNQQTTAQVVVVTVEDLGGEEAWEFALNLGREWGVGNKETDNGVVILLAESDRQIEIAVGYGLEGAIPDSKAGRIIDLYGLEYLKQDDFSKGVTAIANAVINEIYLEYGVTPEGYTPIDSIKETTNVTENSASIIIYWIIMVVIVLLIVVLPSRRRGFVMFGGFGGHSGYGGGFNSRGGFGSGGFSGGGGSFGGGGAGRGF